MNSTVTCPLSTPSDQEICGQCSVLAAHPSSNGWLPASYGGQSLDLGPPPTPPATIVQCDRGACRWRRPPWARGGSHPSTASPPCVGVTSRWWRTNSLATAVSRHREAAERRRLTPCSSLHDGERAGAGGGQRPPCTDPFMGRVHQSPPRGSGDRRGGLATPASSRLLPAGGGRRGARWPCWLQRSTGHRRRVASAPLLPLPRRQHTGCVGTRRRDRGMRKAVRR